MTRRSFGNNYSVLNRAQENLTGKGEISKLVFSYKAKITFAESAYHLWIFVWSLNQTIDSKIIFIIAGTLFHGLFVEGRGNFQKK